MRLKRIIICCVIFFSCLLVETVLIAADSRVLKMEKLEYEQEISKIKEMQKSFATGPTNDLKSFEKFAEEIQNRWSQKNKVYYARLMLEVCGSLSSGRFNDDRQSEVARKYALSALSEPNAIPLDVELELTGHVMTDMCSRNAPKGEDFAQRRKKDVEIRFHAWKRLTDAIDPTWDANDMPLLNVSPPLATGLPAGVDPNAIEDATLRAKYEAAIQKNREKAERYNEQYKLRKWLDRFPQYAEQYIITAYSKSPFNVDELKQYLGKYITDKKTKARILNLVEQNIKEQKGNR